MQNKNNSFGGSPKIKSVQGASEKKKITTGQFNHKKKFLLLKKILWSILAKRLKFGLEGRRKKNVVLENPHHTHPQMINGRPLKIMIL